MASGGERDSRRFRFDLSRLELAGVVVSTAASLFIVFLLGVWAGRGLGDRRLDEPERIVEGGVDGHETRGRQDARRRL